MTISGPGPRRTKANLSTGALGSHSPVCGFCVCLLSCLRGWSLPTAVFKTNVEAIVQISTDKSVSDGSYCSSSQ